MILLLGCLAVGASSPLGAANEPRLFVFADTDMRARAFEKELESQFAGVDITVFSRIRGLQQAMSERPDAVLALEPVLESLGLKADLHGYRSGKATEEYVLLANARTINPSELGGEAKLGVVNILGRKEMPAFVSSVLGAPSPKLAHVTHERDLLSLLQFGAAVAVLTSERWARNLMEKSQMDLKVTPLAKEVGLPAVSYSSLLARSVLEQRLVSSVVIKRRLGVDQWR